MKLAILAVPLVALVLVGCASRNAVITTTQTGFGASVSENPTTQLYEARLGYFRNEFAFVPGNTNDPTTVPDVLMEIRVDNLLKGGACYQRLAVGRAAVTQPGAALMFAKDANGTINSNTVEAVTRKVNAVPLLPLK